MLYNVTYSGVRINFEVEADNDVFAHGAAMHARDTLAAEGAKVEFVDWEDVEIEEAE